MVEVVKSYEMVRNMTMKESLGASLPRPRRVRNTRGREKGEMCFVKLRVLLELRVPNPTHVLEPGDEAGPNAIRQRAANFQFLLKTIKTVNG
jgi:hypothetical protein